MKAHCNRVHLCDSCIYAYPECDAYEIVFGSGRGNDNVIECEVYNQGDNPSVTCPDDCFACMPHKEEK